MATTSILGTDLISNSRVVINGNFASLVGITTTNTASIAALIPNSGYAVPFSGEVQTPADASTYYFGANFFASATTAQGSTKMRIPRGGIITNCFVEARTRGTIGTGERSSVLLSVNGTSDTLIIPNYTSSVISSYFSATINASVAAGDYVEVKWPTPTWSTNPTQVDFWGVVYVQ